MAKRLFFNSLKSRIVLASVLLVTVAVASVASFMQNEVEKLNRTEQYKNAQTLLQSAYFSVENQYKSILFHKETVLAARKDELRSVVNMANALLLTLQGLVESGKLSELEAKEHAINKLRQFRYNNGADYLWINDMGQPYPQIIMNPTAMVLEGKTLDAPEFNCLSGCNKNLFKVFVDTVTQKGEGFINYHWPRPNAGGLIKKQPKISYVKGFAPWNWVIGSGFYVDDLKQQAKKRLEVIINDLDKTFGGIKIAESGYLFIFTGQGKLLFHPSRKDKDFSGDINLATGNKIFDDLLEAANRPDGKLEYIWNIPQHKGGFNLKKMAFVSYFTPLDWYICSSFYVDEIGEPARKLGSKALVFALFFLVLILGLALFTA